MRRPRRAIPTVGCRAFTLIEVLAAVAVLGLLYTVLAGAAAQGLRAEGESARRARASLLADEILTQLELGIELGSTPPLGREEREEEEFLVTVEVGEWTPPLEPAPGVKTAPEVSLLGRAPGASGSPLRRVDVRVAWTEGASELETSRTTFAIDWEAAASALDAVPAPGAPADTGGAPRPTGADKTR